MSAAAGLVVANEKKTNKHGHWQSNEMETQ